MASYCLASTSNCIAFRRRDVSIRSSRRGALVVRASYDVDVEAQRAQTPGAAPGRSWPGGAPPPPPPPPPPPGKTSAAPNRRELLFGLLGAGVGAAATAAYYNTVYDLSDDSMTRALDALLDDPDFLDTVADEALYKQYLDQIDESDEGLATMMELDRELKKLKDDLEAIAKDD